MRTALPDTRVGRITVLAIGASLTLAACRGDSVTGQATTCTDQPGCETIAGAVSPQVLAALSDAGSRLTGELDASTASMLHSRLAQLEAALTARDMMDGRVALAATYDMIAIAERATPAAHPDLDAMRLALVPAARALGVYAVTSSPAAQ